MPPPVRSAEREGRSNHCERRRRARMPIPSADGSAGAVRIFYCIRGGTEHNVRDNDVCVRCENKREGRPNCCGRKYYERGCCGQRRCRQRRRGRKHHARMPIPSADGSADAVRIFYCIQGGTTHIERFPRLLLGIKSCLPFIMLCPSAMPSRDNSSIVASFLLFPVRSRAACAAPLQLNRVKES